MFGTVLGTAGLGAVAAVILAACGNDEPSESGPVVVGAAAAMSPEELVASFTGPRVNVISRDNTFQPQDIEVAAGTLVVWTNSGRNEHDILPVEGDAWGVKPEDFPPGAVYAVVFDTPGTVPYYCSIHGTHDIGMVGSVTVTES